MNENIDNLINNPDYLKSGLNSKQIDEFKNIYGPNKLKEKKKPSLFMRILNQLKDPMVILLIIATVISYVLAIVNVTDSKAKNDTIEIVIGFVEPTIILLIIIANATFGIIQEGKVEKEIAALQKLTSPESKVIRNNELIIIPAEEIVVGDLLFLEAGDSINADATLIEASNLECDEAILTGESTFVKKDLDLIDPSKPIIQHENKIFSGCSVINGSAKAIVTNIGSDTQIGKISELINNEAEKLTPLQTQLHKLSKWIGIAAIIIAFINFFIYITVTLQGNWGLLGSTVGINSVKVSISLAIASVPEGLIAVVMVILIMAVRRMNKKKALIKRLPAVETLGSVSVICTDKTGTLTQNKMTIVKMWQPSCSDLSNDYNSNKKLLEYAGLCSNGDLSIDEQNQIKYVGDPTETCIIKALYDINIQKKDLFNEYPRLKELPFDSVRKLMTVVVKHKNKYLIITKGAPDQILNICNIDNTNLNNANNINLLMGSKALRVLGVAYKYIDSFDEENNDFSYYESNMNFIGLLGIIDPPRLEVKDSINECSNAGIRTIMITGDHKNTASAIAKDLNILIPGTEAISGDELAKISDEELIKNVSKYSVYARVSPSDKIRIVKAWQANDKIVSMTGDGVNDAPSLKAADIGCAMGITGTDVSKQASDVILVDDNFSTITTAVKEGRKLLLSIKNVIVLLLTTNLACLLTIFFGTILFGTGIFSSLQILWNNIIAETIPGFALGLHQVNENVMNFKPREKQAGILDKKLLIKLFLFGFIISLLSLLMFYIGTSGAMENITDLSNHAYDWGYIWHNSGTWIENSVYKEALLSGSSLSFLTISICLSFNAVCLWENKSLFYTWKNPKTFIQGFKNYRNVILAFLGSYATIAFVTYVPKVNDVFNMNPHNLTWQNILPYLTIFLLIGMHELYKFIDLKITKQHLNTNNI